MNHTPPSKAKVENEWSYTTNFHISLHCVDKEKFYIYLLSLKLMARLVTLFRTSVRTVEIFVADLRSVWQWSRL